MDQRNHLSFTKLFKSYSSTDIIQTVFQKRHNLDHFFFPAGQFLFSETLQRICDLLKVEPKITGRFT